ncbi:hypothetical protein SAMN05880501_113106 [Ureibacillus xyleni]|uniref:Uncharacterized protein n=1 Tax=Ureibacillus xyleni TaxID=614648 RepID=A0A285TIS7_9BACL|nr:hypothetical protein [Ureibacillus xyleni]SOC21997.1 hypothetical protein SAMN05880501_113106 [Ureibacillus xyleni]
MNTPQAMKTTSDFDIYAMQEFQSEVDHSLYLYTFSIEPLRDKAFLRIYDWNNDLYFTTSVEGKVLRKTALGQARFVRKEFSKIIQSLRDAFRHEVDEEAIFTRDTSRLLEHSDEAFYDENSCYWFDDWKEMVRVLMKEHGWEKSELRYAMDIYNDIDCTIYFTEFYPV